MPSATSGTTVFNLDVDEIIEAALDDIGGEHTSQDEQRKARRKLNLILIQMQNKNIPLHKIDNVPVPLLTDVDEYLLDFAVQDVMQATLKKDDIETELTRYGVKEYQQLPNKEIKQRPNLFSTERLLLGVNVRVWPIPPDDTYTLNLLVSKKIEDVNASFQKLDLPSRYLPLLTAWLRYELSLGRQGIPENLRAEFKQNYIEAMPDTFEEDRERTDSTLVPGGISGI